MLALETAGKIDSIEIIESELAVAYNPDMTRHRHYAHAIQRQQELYDKLIIEDST